MRRIVLSGLAAGLAGALAPVPAAQAEPEFGGYSTEATATPLQVEVYEPVVPIPAEPQAELELAHTKAEAASGPTGQGLASWLWPGDPVGEGCKTFVEQLQLEDTGLCEDGYPVQVNSQTPGRPSSEKDEPVPGSLMRTSADDQGVRATVGWSPDGAVSDESEGGQAPAPPPGSTDPTSYGDAITGHRTVPVQEEPPNSPVPGLAALVDVDGVVSSSTIETVGDRVVSTATSKLTDVALVGGIITADSITVTTSTSADGGRPTAAGVSKVAGLELAGTPITVGRAGVELADQRATITGLPDEPAQALEELGVSLVLPRPQKASGGDSSSAAFQGLQVVVDTGPLRSSLDGIPFDDIIGTIPDNDGTRDLKSALGALTQLAPRFVVTAGSAASETSTVPQMDLDLGLPTVDPSTLNGAAAPPSTGASSGTSGGAGAAAPSVAGEAVVGEPAAGEAGVVAAEPMSSGLPPLASVPGALTAGGFVIAAGVGWWLQKLGGFVLGGAGSCTHGLETGVPDLRKA